MNLKFEYNGLKLEIQNGDLARVERTVVALFAFVDGKSAVDAYGAVETEERPVKSFRNHVPFVDGVKDFGEYQLYKCAYFCSKCNKPGTRGVKLEDKVTTCHQCKTELIIEPATANEAHDEEHNYFVAY